MEIIRGSKSKRFWWRSTAMKEASAKPVLLPPARPPRYARHTWLMLDDKELELSTRWFVFHTKLFHVRRFMNLILSVSDWQGDAPFLLVVSVFHWSIKIMIGIPNLYCHFPRFPQFDWRLFQPLPAEKEKS